MYRMLPKRPIALLPHPECSVVNFMIEGEGRKKLREWLIGLSEGIKGTQIIYYIKNPTNMLLGTFSP